MAAQNRKEKEGEEEEADEEGSENQPSDSSETQIESWRSPADQLLDKLAALRTLQHISRGVDALSMSDPRGSLRHIELAKIHAQKVNCWPLLSLCADLRGLIGHRHKRYKALAVEDWEREARECRKQSDIDDPGRWRNLDPKVDVLRGRVLGGRGDNISFHQIRPSHVSLALRRGKQLPKLSPGWSTHPMSTGYSVSTPTTPRSEPVTEPAGQSLDNELYFDSGTPRSVLESSSSQSLSQPSPICEDGKARRKVPYSPFVPPPSSPYRRYSGTSPRVKHEPTRYGGQGLPSRPYLDGPNLTNSSNDCLKSPKSPVTGFTSSPTTEGPSSAISIPNSPKSPMAVAKIKARKKSVHIVAWEQPKA